MQKGINFFFWLNSRRSVGRRNILLFIVPDLALVNESESETSPCNGGGL